LRCGMSYPCLRTKVNARSIGTEGEMNELEPNAEASQSLWFAAWRGLHGL
jgi:hypothetical protein